MAKISQAKLKKSLAEALERHGKTTDYYKALANDYLRYNNLKEELMEDCEKNGPRITVAGTNGAMITKDNKSFQLLNNTTKTMLSILKALDIEENELPGDDDGIM